MANNIEKDFYNPFTMAGAIFENFNSKFCADCPTAIANTAEAARKMKTLYSKEAGCCSLCAVFSGFIFSDISALLGVDYEKYQNLIEPEGLNDILKKRAESLKEKYGFDEKYGFFDPENHGCRLPREERSIKCSVYYCNTIGNSFSMEDVGTIMRLRARMIELRKEEMGI